MKIAYSCVIDKNPKLTWEVLVWTRSLIEIAGIDPKDIFVHAVQGVDAALTSSLIEFGVNIVTINIFDPRHRASNKLQQLSTDCLRFYDGVALLDVDMEVLVPYCGEDFQNGTVSGVPVFGPSPSLDVWKKLLKNFDGNENFEEVSTALDFGRGLRTYVNNLNGGLYLIPKDFLYNIGLIWPKLARWLLADKDAYCGAEPVYTDQIAFALAMRSLGHTSKILPSSKNAPPFLLKKQEVCAIHGMRKNDPSLYLPDGTHQRVDMQSNRAALNALDCIVRDANETELGRTWNLHRSMLVHIAAGEFPAAEQAGRLCIERPDALASPYIELAKILVDSGRSLEAISCLERAIQKFPSNTSLRNLQTQLKI